MIQLNESFGPLRFLSDNIEVSVMADAEPYRSVSWWRTAVTETILHETAERHGAMGIVPLGAPWRKSFAMTTSAMRWDWRWRAAFDSDAGHKIS
jgi:hypothetical protein